MTSKINLLRQRLVRGLVVPAAQSRTLRTLAAFAIIPAITWLAFAARLNLTSTSLLQMLAILAIALRVGFWPAAVGSLFANLCINYFFVPPIFSLYISDPQNWIAVGVFEISALIVSRLSTQAHTEATRAVNRELEVERLYEFCLQLLLLAKEASPARAIVHLVERVFKVETAVLFDGFDQRSYSVGVDDLESLASETKAGYASDGKTWQSQNGRSLVRPLREGAQTLGAIGLRGRSLTPITADAISSLVSIALERARSMERESQAEAERKAEQLRTAVLDALAHEYKTPLTALRAAASGLIEIGNLPPLQLELVSLIDSEISRLNSLTTRLVGMSRLDSAKVKPQAELVDANHLVRTVLANMESVLAGHEIHVENLNDDAYIMIDPEMVGMALSQLVDNALKYCDHSHPITVSVSTAAQEVYLSVTNFGLQIPPEERSQLFERFYRGVAASQKAPGHGLGLSITRKVVDAHQGRVWVTSAEETGNTFSMALPRYSKDGL